MSALKIIFLPLIINLFLLTFSSTATPINTTKPRCPPGSVNAGWFVDSAYSFSDPYDCCDSKVKGWKAVDDYEAPYVETGCAISYPVQETIVTRFLYPSSCLSDSDCGEKSFYGSRMTCCSSDGDTDENKATGFCAALKHDGSDRCKKAAETAHWINHGDDDEIDFNTYAGQCYSNGSENHVCLTCANECSEGSIKGKMNSKMAATERFMNSISIKRSYY